MKPNNFSWKTLIIVLGIIIMLIGIVAGLSDFHKIHPDFPIGVGGLIGLCIVIITGSLFIKRLNRITRKVDSISQKLKGIDQNITKMLD